MKQASAALFGIALAFSSNAARAWVYPEHRDIAVLSVQSLDPERQALFDSFWREARAGHGERLCEQSADAEQGVTPDCIDWAALSGIAGDHSCSSQEMLETVTQSDWILVVADIAAQLKIDLSQVAVLPPTNLTTSDKSTIVDLKRYMQSEATRSQRINALRTSDTRLQRADTQYATRAGSNNAHFLIPRPNTHTTVKEYGALTVSPGAETNAVGVYGWYHYSALQKATRLAKEALPPATRQALASAMLFDEAFALHFLQDTYASGHVAGTWGDASQRKGTHDYYNEAGLEVFAWTNNSDSMVLTGDAHMRPEDAERAAMAVRASLEQVLDTAAGRERSTNIPHTPAAPIEPDAFDVCQNNTMGPRPEGLRATPEIYKLGYEVLSPTPVPGLGPGLGAMPRFRAEIGPFVGAAGSFDARYIDGSFAGAEDNGVIGGVDLSLRVGLGLDGVLGESGDGLVFLSMGLRGDSPSTNHFSDSSLAQQGGTLTAATPSRFGLSSRLRMPYYLIPGDLLLLLPLYWIAPETYQDMAVTASNGGLIPWQAGWATRYGRFQFVLGREIGATFYGLATEDALLTTSMPPGGIPRMVNFKSTFIDLPILEYRPYRSFDTSQSSALIFQAFFGIDHPYDEHVVSPAGAPGIDLDTVYSIGLRLVFDWRRYY
jgi:hypothetical protein